MVTARKVWCLPGAVLTVALGACSSSSKPAATSPTTIPAGSATSAATSSAAGSQSTAATWTENAVGAWVSGLVLEDALKAGGLTPSSRPTSAGISKGLQSLHDDTLQGMSPPITFTAGQPHLVDCWSVERLENGVPTVLNNGNYSCKPGSSA
jgi:hypothetical protein